MTTTQESPRQPEAARGPTYRVEESTALLRAIYPNYPNLQGRKPVPDSRAFLQTLRTRNSGASAG